LVGCQEHLQIGSRTLVPISRLVEEVGVWIAVSYATAIVFEIVKLWQASDKRAKHAFLGTKETKTSHR
jgi:hypothetical protein